jgi:hypothetical protein
MSTETSEPAASSTVSRRKTSAESAMPPDVAGGADVSRRAPAPADMQGELEISALDGAAGFLRKNFLVVFGVSLVLLIPCVWHQRIAAGDLASHTYNAWLAQLVEEGKAPRLWLARQWNNVLFDYSLSGVASAVGLRAAEKIVAGAAVLLFFWGAFALICTLTRRTPWFVMPALAAFAYGWTFEQGFMNYYMSLGLALFGLALVARGRGREPAFALVLVPLIWLAHPLGFALLAGMGLYIFLENRLGARAQNFLFAGAIAGLVAVHFYLASQFNVVWNTGPFARKLLRFNGTDQLVTYGAEYRYIAYAMLAFLLICVALEVFYRVRGRESAGVLRLPLRLYAITFVAAFMLPRVLYLPQMLGPQVGLLTERLTSVTAVLALCVVGSMRPQKWQLAGFAAIAAIFFLYLYMDTGTLNRMEAQAETLVHQLPPEQRVVATIWPLPGSRVLIDHFVDRACIGQCYSYGNYEPSSGQFRVRAMPENGIVTANFDDTDAIESGAYVVLPQDLPMSQIYQCRPDMIELCIRPLAAGEQNGRIGYRPARR